jgi:hypothetical protein
VVPGQKDETDGHGHEDGGSTKPYDKSEGTGTLPRQSRWALDRRLGPRFRGFPVGLSSRPHGLGQLCMVRLIAIKLTRFRIRSRTASRNRGHWRCPPAQPRWR